jgi:hypothetical protein
MNGGGPTGGWCAFAIAGWLVLAILPMIIDALLLALHGTYLYVLLLPLFSIGMIPDYGRGKSLITLEWSAVFQLPGTVNSQQPEAYPQPQQQQPSAPTTPQGPS